VSGFSAEWLALREPHDAAARAEAPVAELAATGTRVPGVARVLVDLGAGSGANLRWLAPRLGGQQDWLLVDHEHALLAAIEPRLSSWAAGAGVEVARVGDADGTAAGRARVDSIHSDLALRGATFECRVRRVALDLAGDLDRLEIPHGALVTSSALLDLVSAEWLEALARRCRDAAADVCFALTYDGRTVCVPADPGDAEVLALFNRHQRGDKGFGAALGPTAALRAQEALVSFGYRVTARSSDWRIAPHATEFQHALLAGWLGAALEVAPERRAALEAWHRRRAAHIDASHSELVVGHVDLVGTL